ncbi:PCDAD protein, partial [Crypturellus undulatus]|nr:PCDAD protein [Crypturellus undulatus]
ISYAFSQSVSEQVKDLFMMDWKSGEIRIKGRLDFEDIQSYDLEIEAIDKGNAPLTGHCSVELEVLDVND